MTRPDPLKPPPGINGRRADAQALARRVKAPADPLQNLFGCPPPVWMNRDDQKRPDGRCARYQGVTRCTAPAVQRTWIGCTAGEHLDRSDLCETHAILVGNLKVLHCQRCWDALGIISDARVIKTEPIEGA